MKTITAFKLEIALFFSVFILYFLTRLINLNIIPVFVDEAIYTRWSQIILSDQSQWFIPLSDGKQPLFMWLSTIPLRFITDPLIATRSISVVAGFIGLIGIWLLSKELFDKKVAWMSSLLYIFCPFLFFYNRLAVPDGLLTTFFIYVALLSVYIAKHQRLDFSLILGWVLGGGLLTKSTAALSILAMPTSLSLVKLSKENGLKKIIKIFGLWGLSLVAGFLLYNILHLSPLYYLIAQRTPDFIFTPKEVLKHPIDPFIFRFPEVAGWLIGYLTAPIFLIFLLGIGLLIKSDWRKGIFLAVWFFLPLLIEMEIAKGFTPRYFIFVAPFALIPAAYLMREIFKKFGKLNPIFILVILLPAMVFQFLLLTNPEKAPIPFKEKDGYLEEWSAGYGIYEISSYLRSLPSSQSITVITEGTQGYGTLPDGLQMYLRGVKNVTVSGLGQKLVIDSVPEDLISDAKIHPAFLVVNNERFFDKQNSNLKLIASYPKADGKNPLLFYQVLSQK